MYKVTIGGATLYHGDCRELLPTLRTVDAVITDPPYSARTHNSHNGITRRSRDGRNRRGLSYEALTQDDASFFVGEYARICTGWIVWITDSHLATYVRGEMERAGRYAFSPLPFYAPGRSVRLSGDGPNSWTDWIVVSRTKKQIKWGTLPGGYVAGPGWYEKERIGGKPVLLMDALVRDYSRQGHTVLDTHMGAGTTGVACVKAGRNFIGCEIDLAAFDLACKRIEQAHAQLQLLPTEASEQEHRSFSFLP